MIAGILLAAGESRRMGFPKPLLPYQGATFLDHLLGVLQGQVDPLVLVEGAVKLPRSPEVTVVTNYNWPAGQLSSLQCGLRALPATADAALVALVDHPCIDRELVARLIA